MNRITVFMNDEEIENAYSAFKFSGGEIQVRLHDTIDIDADFIKLEASIQSSDDLMELLLLTDAIRRKISYLDSDLPINLVLRYMPYARQDRVCYPGESLALRVICDIINAQNYKTVGVWDPHSDATLALLNNSYSETPADFLESYHFTHYTLIAPDAGAVKRVMEASKKLNLPMITAEKRRDPKTGEITGTKVDVNQFGYATARKFLIVDDICDGGRTFIELAKQIRLQVSFATVDLYVTNGIFSKGFEVFDGLIDTIYVANCFIDYPPANVKIL